VPLSGIKIERFSALMNGIFVGVGIIFLLWGATDIAFPITERFNVAVFGLLRITLGIISLSVGVGVESVQWAKIGKDLTPSKTANPAEMESNKETNPAQPISPVEPQQTTS